MAKAAAALEQRILSKVSPLEGRILPDSTQFTQLPHNHQKGKQCRSCRTLRKLAREDKGARLRHDSLDAIKDVTVGSLAAVLFGIGETAKEFVGGVFKVGTAIAGNPDPVSQGIAIGGGVVTLAWFINAYPEIAHFLRLESLGFKGLASSITAAVGRDDQNGLFGIEAVDASGVDYGDRWYIDTKHRDLALILLSGGTPVNGLYPKGALGYIQDASASTGYRKTSRKYPGGSIYFTATPPLDNPDALSAIAAWKVTAPKGSWWIIVGQIPGNSWLVVNRNTVMFSDADFSAQAAVLVSGTAYQTQVTV
jgi:hypothetical protein